MKFSVFVQPDAERDIAGIHQWLKSRSTAGAARWFNRFTSALQALATDPQRYALAPEAEFLGREIRQLLFKTRRGRTYRAVFIIEGAVVHVLHVRGPGQPLLDADDV